MCPVAHLGDVVLAHLALDAGFLAAERHDVIPPLDQLLGHKLANVASGPHDQHANVLGRLRSVVLACCGVALQPAAALGGGGGAPGACGPACLEKETIGLLATHAEKMAPSAPVLPMAPLLTMGACLATNAEELACVERMEHEGAAGALEDEALCTALSLPARGSIREEFIAARE
jgi:hypothetical protein